MGVLQMVNIETYTQTGIVQSEVCALYSVIIPILQGILYSLKREVLKEFDLTYDTISLSQLARIYREGDGDCGICFEYAVHNAIVNNNAAVLERIDTALVKYCKIKNGSPSSILFGAEKSGALQLIDSVTSHLTNDSYLLTGSVGQPIKLKKHIQGVINAFRKPQERGKLPNSINGLWKADLFVGKLEPDKWVGTTVKSNPSQLEGARGLRLAIVPSSSGKNDKIYKHETKNLIVCPLPYDQSFTEIFYRGWNVVRLFLNADANVPKEMLLPNGAERLVCKELNARKKYPVLGVLEFLEVVKQPYLLDTHESMAKISVENETGEDIKINRIVAPMSLK